MVNSDVFDLIRDGKAEWLRGDILRMTENGVLFNHRAKNVPKGGPGREDKIKVDMVISKQRSCITLQVLQFQLLRLDRKRPE